jgi:glucokinase
MSEHAVLGIDLGGTKIAASLVDKNRCILWEDRVLTEASSGVDHVIAKMVDMVHRASQQTTLIAIGLGIPGPLDLKKGLVIKAPNLGWQNVPIVQRMQAEVDVPVYLENDANAAGLGEQVFGAGKDISDLIYLTVSTGIGGGFVVNNRLVRGRDGGAGEIGHIIVEENGPLCGCGQRGCLETMASGTAIARMMNERLKQGQTSKALEIAGGQIDKVDTVAIGKAALEGDPLAKDVICFAMSYLGKAVANMVTIFNPGMVIIGGGVANIGDLLFEPVKEAVRTRTFTAFAEGLSIVPPALEGRAGVLGAAAVALQEVWGKNN